jgi:hypothetical protein
MVFSEGLDQGQVVKRDLEAAGFQVTDQESQMVWTKFQISGRQDFTICKEGVNGKIRVEVKSAAPYTYAAVNKPEDLYGSSKDWLVRWYRQICLYCVLQGVPKYWLLLKDKSRGRIKIIEFIQDDRMLETAEWMIKKAEHTNKLIQIEATSAPIEDKLTDPDVCSECAFFDTCLPELQFGPGARVLTEEEASELAKMCVRREELESAKKEYMSLDEDIKDAVKAAAAGANKVVIEDWIASIKEVPKKAYTVAAHTEQHVKVFRAKS